MGTSSILMAGSLSVRIIIAAYNHVVIDDSDVRLIDSNWSPL